MAKTKVHGEYLKDSVVRFTAKAGENITKGQPVYISGISGELPVVSLADADNTAKMPAFGLAEATVSTNGELEVTSFGTLAGLDTSSYSLGDILYVDTTAGALTNNPSGLEATKLQNIGIVQRVHASNGSIKVGGAGRTNAVPNLDNGDIFIGDSNNKAISSSLATEIESYLDGGTSSPVLASLTVDTNTLYVDSTNNAVGIGTSTTNGLLTLKNTNPASSLLSIQSYASTSEIANIKLDQATDILSINTSNIAGGIAFGTGTSGTERMRINSSGDVFVGGTSTTNAQTWGRQIASINSGTTGASLTLKDANGEWQLATYNNLFYLTQGSNTRLLIDSSGNVGIGTSNPGQKLDVTGSTGADYIAAFENTNATNGYGILAKTAHAGTSAYAFAAYSGSNPLMVVRGDGNVGIGTSSPARSLHIRSTGEGSSLFLERTSNYGFVLYNEVETTTETFHLGFVNNGTFSSDILVANESGNVGIGTASPQGRLSISGSNTPSQPIVDITATGTGTWQRGVRMLNSGMSSGDSIMYAVGRSDNSRNMGQTYFYYDGDDSTSNRISMGLHSVDDVFNILGTGNVGIGTTSPSDKLHVAGTSLFDGNTYIGGSSTLYIPTGGNIKTYSGGTTYTAMSHTLSTDGNFNMIRFGAWGYPAHISSSDFRSPSPDDFLNQGVSFHFTSYALNNTANWADMMVMSTYSDASGGDANAFLINKSTNGAKIARQGFNSSSNFSAGNIYTLDYTSASDARVKENVQDITNGLEIISQLRPVTYEWTDDYILSGASKNANENIWNQETESLEIPDVKTINVGLIAQEVEEILPTVVHEDNISIEGIDGGLKNISYEKLVPHLISAVKELKARIETLENN